MAEEVATESDDGALSSPSPIGTPRQMKDPKLSPKDFTKIRELGCGDLGKVYLVRSNSLPQDGVYALKVLDKAELRRRQKEQRVQTERDVLAASKHPYIATLYCSFQTKKKLYFVLQYCAGGELMGLIWKQPGHRLEEEAARYYAAEVLVALEYLHAIGFIYRDLKPENVLVHRTGHVILTDFDLAAGDVKVHDVTATLKSHTGPRFNRRKLPKPVVRAYRIKSRQMSFVGTTEYMAPEVLEQDGYDQRVDWWEFGILIYEMLFGCTPFQGHDRDATFDKIHDGKLKIPSEPKVSRQAKKLIRELLRKDRNKRLCGAGQIRRHKWFAPVEWALLRHREPPMVPDLKSPDDASQFYLDSEDMERFHDSDFDEDEEGEEGDSDLEEDYVGASDLADGKARYRKWKGFDYFRHGGDEHWAPAEMEHLVSSTQGDAASGAAAPAGADGEDASRDSDEEEASEGETPCTASS